MRDSTEPSLGSRRTWNDQLSQRTSPPETERFEPCGADISTGFATGRARPESAQAWLGVSGGGGKTPRSVTETTFLATRSTMAITFSIGLPQTLLPAPDVSTQGTLSRRRPTSAGAVTGPMA